MNSEAAEVLDRVLSIIIDKRQPFLTIVHGQRGDSSELRVTNAMTDLHNTLSELRDEESPGAAQTAPETAEKYAGADHEVRPDDPPESMSDLGRDVADLLGQLFRGIYHIDTSKVDWSQPDHITLTMYGSLSTFDFPQLTELVVLAHDRAIRCEVSGCAPSLLRLMFHRRRRTGSVTERHPTIEVHIETIRDRIGMGIVGEVESPAVPATVATATRTGRPEVRSPEPEASATEGSKA